MLNSHVDQSEREEGILLLPVLAFPFTIRAFQLGRLEEGPLSAECTTRDVARPGDYGYWTKETGTPGACQNGSLKIHTNPFF